MSNGMEADYKKSSPTIATDRLSARPWCSPVMLPSPEVALQPVFFHRCS